MQVPFAKPSESGHVFIKSNSTLDTDSKYKILQRREAKQQNCTMSEVLYEATSLRERLQSSGASKAVWVRGRLTQRSIM
jgi:hypothetical protein